jgi:hypothetical protein
MSASSIVLAASFITASCATGGNLDLGAAEPRWSQRPEEAKLLPVGKVLSVNRLGQEIGLQLTKPGAAGMTGQVGVQADVQAIALTTGRGGVSVFRHTVRLQSGQIREVDTEYQFKVGDCVAVRTFANQQSKSTQLVEALPGACA